MKTMVSFLILAWLLLLTATPVCAQNVAGDVTVPKDVAAVLNKFCAECHGEQTREADVRLDALASIEKPARLDVMGKAQEQLAFGLMPPRDALQPSAEQRQLLIDWFSSELRKNNAPTLEDKLRLPSYGNRVDHSKLFSGEVKAKPFTPARRWLVSPQIFTERVLDVFQLQGQERDGRRLQGFYGVTNPFVLPDQSGVRYYDLTALDGGHLLVMLGNAQWITARQLRPARVKKGELKADQWVNQMDRWTPKTTPAAFEQIVLKTDAPTDDEITNAVQAQFECVLQRRATDEELRKYVALTRDAITLGGNVEGLRQMLVTVLLESEFLYRLEFGAGPADEHGRVKLSPREASFAISYALGDRGPDAKLKQTAEEGRLLSQEDYKREVQRLLADQTYYRAPVDVSLSGSKIQSHVTSHPKLVRFIREFFGYPTALKVFKDRPRSGGYYENPDRGHLGTPGWLIQEADELVIECLKQDERVFETLLTTDRFFVYHNMDTKAGHECIELWKRAYETIKDSDWKTKPDDVMSEHHKLLVTAKIVDPRTKEKELWKEKRAFLSYMYYFQDTFGQGRTPFTRGPFTHGYTYHHSQIYNLPPLPERGRYERVETPNYKEPTDHPEYWDYPVEQPFPIAHRKGLLTHPAWLIAHSQNSATDPIRRGKWIREKLLAGSVPDVPITVDAQIPEHADKTLRERLAAATSKQECWKCHQHMNPLGLAFEMYDDFGRHRTEESLEHPDNVLAKASVKNGADTYRTVPLISTGRLEGTGDATLDGDVTDALDMIDRLAKSDRVRQSIIRHAFRFFLGRNELLSDSQTLIDADRAYVSSGGSFQAVVVSLLCSESMMYRK